MLFSSRNYLGLSYTLLFVYFAPFCGYINLEQWINGKLEIVWAKEVATARYVYPVPK
jgi:hypothetical protein